MFRVVTISSMDELPERCWDCPLQNKRNGKCQADEEGRSSEWRPFWCPLKEKYIIADIEKSETIIEAEEG